MSKSYARGEKAVLAVWFLIVCIVVSGCDIDCSTCGLRANQVVIVQDPNGGQTYSSAGDDGCYLFHIPDSQHCSDWIVTGI